MRSGEVMPEAVKIFKALIVGECMARPDVYIVRWTNTIESRHNLNNAHCEGRHWKLDDAEARAAADPFCMAKSRRAVPTSCTTSSSERASSDALRCGKTRRERVPAIK